LSTPQRIRCSTIAAPAGCRARWRGTMSAITVGELRLQLERVLGVKTPSGAENGARPPRSRTHGSAHRAHPAV
jgi:hypothetical protein